MSIRDDLKAAIFGQESSSGKADTSKPNDQGARGPMQVTLDTFNGMKANGWIPANYNHANPAHTTEAGNVLIDRLFDKYGEDRPDQVAAAYYGGEKAVRPDGSIANFGNLKHPEQPKVRDYVTQVLGRIGQQANFSDDEDAPARQRTTLDQAWNSKPSELAQRPDAVTSTKRLPGSDLRVMPNTTLNAPGVDIYQAVQARNEADAKEQKRKDDLPYSEVNSAVIMNGPIGAFIKYAARPTYEPQAGFKMDWDAARKNTGDKPFTSPEIDLLSQAVSPESQRALEWEVRNNRDTAATASAKGGLYEGAVDFAVNLPAYVLPGIGVEAGAARLGLGATQLAARGSLGAARAAAVGEQVVGNTLLTAAQSQIDPYVSTHNFFADASMGVIGSLLHMRGLNRTFAAGVEMRAAADLRNEALAKRAGLEAQARLNLGAQATPDMLSKEVERIESQQLQDAITKAAQAGENGKVLDIDVAARTEQLAELEKAGLKPVNDIPTALEKDTPPVFDAKTSGRTVEDILAGEGRTPDTRSAGAILDGIAAGTDDKLASTLAARLRQHLGDNDINVHILSPEDTARIAMQGDKVPRGFYRGNQNEIVVNAAHAADPYLHLHEISHALSVSRLAAGAKGLDPVLSKLTTEIEQLRVQVKAKLDQIIAEGGSINGVKPMKGGKADYYLSNSKEFIAGLYSGNGMFNSLLKGIRVEGEQTFYSKFVGKVAKLLGISKGADLDAFTHMLNKSDELMSQKLTVKRTNAETGTIETADFAAPAGASADFRKRYGIDLLPAETASQKAEKEAITRMYQKAEGTPVADEGRLSKLMNTSIFQGGQAIANVMARSKNPLVRFLSQQLLENPSGALGRNSTAAMTKFIEERKYLGNIANDYDSFYKTFAQSRGEGWLGYLTGKQRGDFDLLVAKEIESRRAGAMTINSHEAVRAAADKLEEAYTRMLKAQQDAKTLGYQMLPDSSKGYMPHRMEPGKVLALSNDERRTIIGALSEQFQSISGFDKEFSDKLALKYVDRVRQRALGGFDSPVGIHQVGSSDLVEQALRELGFSEDVVQTAMKRYTAGQASHTKARLDLDLNKVYTKADGTEFRLMDVMQTDQLALLRSMSGRVSGEVSLAKFGIKGRPDLDMLRRAIQLGEDGAGRTADETLAELKAWDQMVAEFMHQPYGSQNQNLNRLMLANVLTRMGGAVWSQVGEGIQALYHVGAMRAMDSVASMPRLVSEIHALAKGKAVDNPILGSIEKQSGVDFGLDSHRMHFPNVGIDDLPAYGKDTIGGLDRLLRGGVNLQGRISLWRTVHSVQQRGMAEQIVRKAGDFIAAGVDDVALKDMGISAKLAKTIRDSGAYTYENGHVVGFDITKVKDLDAAEEFVQAIHRGTAQIIQGTFIGERGRWAHDGMMRLLTQFRTFSLTSVEKQWARQVGNHGPYKALGLLLGSMSVAAPIYAARVYAQSIGREDQDVYIEKNLTPFNIAKQTLNYVGMSGLSGDALDIMSTLTGIGEAGGGRRGAGGKGAIGNLVAPAAGTVDDLYKALQPDADGHYSPEQLLKLMPYSRVPVLLPAVQALGQ